MSMSTRTSSPLQGHPQLDRALLSPSGDMPHTAAFANRLLPHCSETWRAKSTLFLAHSSQPSRDRALLVCQEGVRTVIARCALKDTEASSDSFQELEFLGGVWSRGYAAEILAYL